MNKRINDESPARERAHPPKPVRIRRERRKGWRLPPNTVCVTRGTPYGNPFRIGRWFMKGDPHGRTGWNAMIYCETPSGDSQATLIADAAVAVEWHRWLMETHPVNLTPLRGKNLACFCGLDAPCHADTLLRLANP